MAGSVQEFYSAIGKYTDFARGNRFQVVMNVPTGLAGKWSKDRMKDLSFLCEAAELPGRNLATIDRRTYGVSEKLPMQTVYQDITLTMLCTDDENKMWQKNFFEDWMELIHPSDSYNLRYKNEYTVDFKIIQYSVKGEEVGGMFFSEEVANPNYAVNIIEAYPVNMNQLGLSWADDGFLRLSMTFAYTRWERALQKSTQNSIQQNLDDGFLQATEIPPPKNVGHYEGSTSVPESADAFTSQFGIIP